MRGVIRQQQLLRNFHPLLPSENLQAPHATVSLLRLGVAAIGLALAADASAQSLKVTGLTQIPDREMPGH